METILIQDADEAIADIVITALRIEGYHAYRLKDDHESILEMIQGHQARLVLLDSWLMRQSAQLCARIKAHFPKLPVIAFSCDSNLGKNYRASGFDGYLSKPFELKELYRLARKFLPGRNKKQAVEELESDC